MFNMTSMYKDLLQRIQKKDNYLIRKMGKGHEQVIRKENHYR